MAPGCLQAFAERFASEPRIFFGALEAALAPTDLELVDGGLREILALSRDDDDVADHLARLRATNSHAERATLWQSLAHGLARRGGIDLSHALSVSLNSRLLRSGSGPVFHSLLLALQEHWDALERRFGLIIGLREFSYICSKDPALSAQVRAFLASTLPAGAIAHVTVLAAVSSLLWPREAELRQRALQSFNPYRGARTTDPALVRHLLLAQSVETIALAEPSWRDQVHAAFDAQGICRIVVDAADAAALRPALVELVSMPVDIGFLQFFPVVERVERFDGRISVSLILREQV